ncbi:hypothetical protein Y032_0024g893 [Ancylostoma ceylanicum]|uniref:Uncharacterized protein n=1 Tax=Ancylostoma ceylanicum TaxID=53326 RepID=A0A016UWC2_9BILA|nr:hypothetical protein Y032_0024g893 [Ancylostoma ceylanicum]
MLNRAGFALFSGHENAVESGEITETISRKLSLQIFGAVKGAGSARNFRANQPRKQFHNSFRWDENPSRVLYVKDDIHLL